MDVAAGILDLARGAEQMSRRRRPSRLFRRPVDHASLHPDEETGQAHHRAGLLADQEEEPSPWTHCYPWRKRSVPA
jgi:hypothetical protein